MKINAKSPIVSFTLVALAISLIVNFSYLLLMVVNQNAEVKGNQSAKERKQTILVQGTLAVSVDGFG